MTNKFTKRKFYIKDNVLYSKTEDPSDTNVIYVKYDITSGKFDMLDTLNAVTDGNTKLLSDLMTGNDSIIVVEVYDIRLVRRIHKEILRIPTIDFYNGIECRIRDKVIHFKESGEIFITYNGRIDNLISKLIFLCSLGPSLFINSLIVKFHGGIKMHDR